MTPEQRLAAIFTELADTLVSDFDVVDFLDMRARRCVELLGVAATGIMLTDDSTLRVMAASDETARLLGLLDLPARDGPCVECLRSGARVVDTPLSSVTSVGPALTEQLGVRTSPCSTRSPCGCVSRPSGWWRCCALVGARRRSRSRWPRRWPASPPSG
ncbi:MAG TPA: hypothetical protein VIM19_14255 [Actinomycetes bacterium]